MYNENIDGNEDDDGQQSFVCKFCSKDMDCTRTSLACQRARAPSHWRLSDRTEAIYMCTARL